MKKIYPLYIICFAILYASFTSCTIDHQDEAVPEGVSNDLHFAFKTPDWERTIDCTSLNLVPMYANESTDYIFATSSSTKSTFFLVLPSDEAEFNNQENLGRYAITEYGEIHAGPFSFSLKLPINVDERNLVSIYGFSEDSYNEVVSIEYKGEEGNFNIYHFKGLYEMNMVELGNFENKKKVSGTYHLRVKIEK